VHNARVVKYYRRSRIENSSHIRYIPGRQNKVADCLSRITEDMTGEQVKILRPTETDFREDFILSITKKQTPTHTSPQTSNMTETEKETDKGQDGQWITYSFHCQPKNLTIPTTTATDTTQPAQSKPLNADALPFQPQNPLQIDAITTPLTSSDPIPTGIRRSARLAEKRLKHLTVNPSSSKNNDQQLTTDRTTSNEQIDVQQPEITTSQILSKWARDKTEQDSLITSEIAQNLTDKPRISPMDYQNDTEFSSMYNYLRYNIVTGDDKIDRKTFLLAENYFIEDDYLYKISLPRNQKERRLRPTFHQLCVPLQYRQALIHSYHDLLGHYAIGRLQPTMIVNYFWRDMIHDIKQYVKTCSICQCSKIPTKPRKSPLHPIPIPNRPFALWSFDHKKLVRTTEEGNNFILVFIDHFSSYVVFKAVKDESAYTTARVFVSEIVAHFGIPKAVISDKAAGFMSIFFNTISRILGVNHRTSAVQSSRTNGSAERAIQCLNASLRLYATPDIDDRNVELILPIAEYALRSIAPKHAKISPFEICYGFPMPVPAPFQHEIPSFISSDAESYAHWLKNALSILHTAVRENRQETKSEMKEYYDKSKQTSNPTYIIGDYVLLKDTRISPGSTRVLTHQPYSGPYIIQDIICYDENIGPAYKLIHAKTGKAIKRLVNVDRIKHFNKRTSEQTENASAVTITASDNDDLPRKQNQARRLKRACCILEERYRNGKKEYLVLFANKRKRWTDLVGQGLITDYESRNRMIKM